MRHHIDHALLHQRGKADRRAAIIGEHHEGAAIGNDAAMQRHAVHRRAHAVFADAPAHIAPAIGLRLEVQHVLGLGVVGRRQIRRTAHGAGHDRVDDFQHAFARLARRDDGLFGNHLLFEFVQRIVQRMGNVARQRVVEILRRLRGGFALVPFRARRCAALADLAPLLQHAVIQRERAGRQIERLLRACHFVGARRIAVRLLRARARRHAEADDRLAVDHHRLLGFLRRGQRAEHIRRIVAVAPIHLPA